MECGGSVTQKSSYRAGMKVIIKTKEELLRMSCNRLYYEIGKEYLRLPSGFSINDEMLAFCGKVVKLNPSSLK